MMHHAHSTGTCGTLPPSGRWAAMPSLAGESAPCLGLSAIGAETLSAFFSLPFFTVTLTGHKQEKEGACSLSGGGGGAASLSPRAWLAGRLELEGMVCEKAGREGGAPAAQQMLSGGGCESQTTANMNTSHHTLLVFSQIYRLYCSEIHLSPLTMECLQLPPFRLLHPTHGSPHPP